MDHTYVKEKSLKSLEDLAIFLTTSLISLQTLHNIQVRAIEIGIMKEDMNERANTIAWDLRRIMNLHHEQLEAVLELLPDGFDPSAHLNKIINSKTK